MADQTQQDPNATSKKGGRKKSYSPKPDDKTKKGKKGKDEEKEEKAEGEGKNAELLKKIEEALALKTAAHKRAKEIHFKHFCHLSPWIRLPLAMLVDLIDAVLGIIPGVDMAGTFLATCAAYILWGDMGFLAAWEVLPKLVNMLHLGTKKEEHSRWVGWLISLTPTVTIVGIITIINEHRHGHALCRPISDLDEHKLRPETALVAHKRELDPAWGELARSVKERTDRYVVCKRELDPSIPLLFKKIKDGIKSIPSEFCGCLRGCFNEIIKVFKKLKFW